MKKLRLILILFALTLTQGRLVAQTAEADSMDVLHYDITLDMGNTVAKQVQGTAEITFVLTKNCNRVTFDLIADNVSPISLDGTVTRGFDYDRDNALLTVYVDGHVGDTHVVSVPYVTNGYVESYGWGGLHMDNYLYYNLGVAFMAHPHVYGRAWFPCRDNFYDKATYRLTVTSQPGWRAICGGLRQSEVTNADSSNTSVWTIDHPTPTYLVSVSSAPWRIIEREYESLYGTYPAIIGYMSRDSILVYDKFDVLEDVLPAFERAFGPYRWDRIGYIGTPKGSMEHVSNIGLVDACIAVADEACQMTTCHELGHAWFGNLLTCASEGDMWINEGGASFCEEVAMEAIHDRAAATRYYLDMLREVLLTAHQSDQGYRALSGMSPNHTYGTTTYKKGALVWHSLRGVMGDSLFYACMNRLFDRCAFGNIDAAGLRDSLSLYSGMDLEGFFDFHVFNPGFVDYAIEGLETTWEGSATLTLRQQLRGTDHYAHGQRVPVTFFSQDNQMSDQWITVDDSIATQTFALPFVAAYAVVDYRNLISDAATNGTVTLNHTGTYDMGNTYCKVYVGQNANMPINHQVHVTHHFSHPTGEVPEGVARLADHYWEVHSAPWDQAISIRLLYNMGANSSSGASCLDMGFYDNRATLDSMCVLYRLDAQHPWQMVSRKRTASSNISTGYFTTPLFPGQYVLAVADTNIVGISPIPTREGTDAKIRLFPNPGHSQFQVVVEGCNKKFDLSVFDTSGKKVLTAKGLKNGDMVRHDLAAGSYVVIIKNNYVSLQSQIIVQ
jgi:aminopeptidase N